MDNLVQWTFEIDREIYDEAVKVCDQLGTTVEIMAESFIRFCVVPENFPLLEAYINSEKAPADVNAKEEINRKVFEKVFAIARQETERRNGDTIPYSRSD